MKKLLNTALRTSIRKAFNLIDKFSWTKEELEIYDTIAVYQGNVSF
jgi:hypothetical protein